MKRSEVTKIVNQRKLVAVVRVDDADDLPDVANALLEGGVSIIELTMTIPHVLDKFSDLKKQIPDDVLLGMGSVLNGETAEKVAAAGADFIVSPIMKAEIIEAAHKAGVPAMVGAYTPSEIQQAHELGADAVKVFPADKLGPAYIKAVKAPMPHLNLLPTGGVSVDNVHEWLNAGVFALGVGGALVDKKAITEGRFDILTEKARQLSEAVKKAGG